MSLHRSVVAHSRKGEGFWETSEGDFEELEKSVGINHGKGMLMSTLLRCCATAKPSVIRLYDLVAFPL
jgi:hypothetical protein